MRDAEEKKEVLNLVFHLLSMCVSQVWGQGTSQVWSPSYSKILRLGDYFQH